MTTTETTANERVALLMGWEKIRRISEADPPWTLMRDPSGNRAACPDFTQWGRFPEMQEFIRGLPLDKRNEIARKITGGLDGSYLDGALDVLLSDLPSRARDAIDEVCG